MINKLKELEQKCQVCTKCYLCQSRSRVVFSGGVPADVVLIGEAPGANEDEQGQPFVGRSGKLLDSLLAEAGLFRDKNLYIINTIKCRPPENRDPSQEELNACREYLDVQLDIIKPKIILLCGKIAVKAILNTKEPISKIRGQWFEGGNDVKIMPLFHPAYLLRSPSTEVGKPKYLMLQDMKTIKNHLKSV